MAAFLTCKNCGRQQVMKYVKLPQYITRTGKMVMITTLCGHYGMWNLNARSVNPGGADEVP